MIEAKVRTFSRTGKRYYEVFTTPKAVEAELRRQGDYEEICLTIEDDQS